MKRQAFIYLLIVAGTRVPAPAQQTGEERDPARTIRSDGYGQLPLNFEANAGQAADKVRFVSQGSGYSLALNDSEAVLAFGGNNPQRTGDIVRMRLSGGRPIRPHGDDLQPGTANYFVGSAPSQWRTAIPTYAKVRYAGLYPGIDLVYYGKGGRLEYDFVVAPYASPKHIQMRIVSARGIRIRRDGDLVIAGLNGEIAFQRPEIYQKIDGKRVPVAGSFALLGRDTVGFHVASYDRSVPLVIDPTLSYSTYLNASNGFAIAADGAGSAYITGLTSTVSTTPGAFQTSHKTAFCAYVAKFNPQGSALVYSTYLCGTGLLNSGAAIAVDSAGNAYIGGQTTSGDFPVTMGALQTQNTGVVGGVGGGIGFITKLNPTGTALIYSTYLNGTAGITGIALDAATNAYVTGQAAVSLATTPGAFSTTSATSSFVSKINPAGNAFVYSTYLGGSSGTGIAVDAAGNAYVNGRMSSIAGYLAKVNAAGTALIYTTVIAGTATSGGIAVDPFGSAYATGSTGYGFNPTGDPLQTTSVPPGQLFALKMNPAGSAFTYATTLGQAYGKSIAVDACGNAYLTGFTAATDFPVTADAFQPSNKASTGYNFAYNGVVSKLNSAGTSLLYSTYLGAASCPTFGACNTAYGGYGIALDSAGNAYVTGLAASGFPTTANAFQTTSGGDATFVAKFSFAAVNPPAINSGGIVPVYSSASTVQSGAWASIYGSNLTGGVATWNGDFPTSLGGVGVTVNGKPAYLWYVSPTQINFQAPDDTATGPVSVVVSTPTGCVSSTVTLSPYAPSFSLLSSKYPAAYVLTPGNPGNSGAGYDLIGPVGAFSYPTRPARAGETVVLYGVGFGPTTSPVAAGKIFLGAAPTNSLPQVTIGGVPANVTFAGIVQAGLYQLNVVIPNIGSGDKPLQATAGSANTQGGVVLTIQ